MSSSPSRAGWIRAIVRDILLSLDLLLGLLSGALFYWLSDRYFQVRSYADEALLGFIPLGLAMFATARSQTTTFLGHIGDESYERFIQAVGGIQRALLPFRAATIVSVILVVYSVLSRMLIGLASASARSILLGIGVGLFAWAAIGILQTYALETFHGTQRFELNRHKRAAGDILASKRKEHGRRQGSQRKGRDSTMPR